MKHIGTLRCKLFGHKFLTSFKDNDDVGTDRHTIQTTPFCINCGIKREEL